MTRTDHAVVAAVNLIGMGAIGPMLEYAAGPKDAKDTSHEEKMNM